MAFAGLYDGFIPEEINQNPWYTPVKQQNEHNPQQAEDCSPRGLDTFTFSTFGKQLFEGFELNEPAEWCYAPSAAISASQELELVDDMDIEDQSAWTDSDGEEEEEYENDRAQMQLSTTVVDGLDFNMDADSFFTALHNSVTEFAYGDLDFVRIYAPLPRRSTSPGITPALPTPPTKKVAAPRNPRMKTRPTVMKRKVKTVFTPKRKTKTRAPQAPKKKPVKKATKPVSKPTAAPPIPPPAPSVLDRTPVFRLRSTRAGPATVDAPAPPQEDVVMASVEEPKTFIFEEYTPSKPPAKKSKLNNGEASVPEIDFTGIPEGGFRCAYPDCSARLPTREAAHAHHSSGHPGIANPKQYGSAPFRCWHTQCTHQARLSGDIPRHMQSLKHQHHSHVCAKCGSTFTRIDALRRHKGRPKSCLLAQKMKGLA